MPPLPGPYVTSSIPDARIKSAAILHEILAISSLTFSILGISFEIVGFGSNDTYTQKRARTGTIDVAAPTKSSFINKTVE